MSNPLLPSYLGSWEQLMEALLHNPFLGGGGGGILPNTHPEAMRSDSGMAMSGLGSEPNPFPWRFAVSSLIAVISLREVASKMPDGQVKIELGKRVDSAISRFIDDCGTRHPGWPWPGPPPWVYPIASELSVAANTITEGNVRNEVLKVAGQIIERASGSTGRREVKLPSSEEIDAMTEFPSNDHECEVLCQELLDTFDELQGATGLWRLRLLARLRAINARRRAFHCKPCLPE
ncbi:MAG: hypothetical protein ABIS20_18480 [Thermoanaerobaculia bacterium]